MDINAKIKLLAETMTGYSVVVDSSNGANVELSKVAMPCILVFIQDTGEFKTDNSHYRDSVNIRVAFLNKMPKGFKESDVESMRYDLKQDMILLYHKLKYDLQFKINNESVKYDIVYDEFDDNLLGVAFNDNVKERVGINLACETPDSIVVAPTSVSFCQKVSECSSIISINQLLDGLQEQIDNLPTGGAETLQEVIINGNKVYGRVVESDDGLTFMFISDSAINLQNNLGALYGIINAANGSVTIISGDGTTSEYSIVSITKDAIQLQVTDTFITSNINQTKNGIDLVAISVSKNGYELATENFVNNRVQSNIKIIGDWDATSGSYPLADESNTTPFITQWGATIKAGWAFRVGYGQAGTVDGFDYENGDVVYSLVDSPTDNSSDWGDLDHNLQQADESLRGTAKIVTAAIIADETSTDDERIVTTKKLWLNFWTRVLAIAHTFAAKITFTTAPRFNSASASQYLKVDATKDLTSVSAIPAADITEDSLRRFVTDLERLKINRFSYTDTVLGTVTVTNQNTLSKSVLIPANTMNSGALNIKGRAVKSGSISFAWLNIYINSANNLSGAKLIGQINSSGGNTLANFSIDRTIPIQSGSFVAFTINSTNGFEETVTNSVSTQTIDWTVDQYIILACQCNSAADSMRANFLSVNQH